MVENLITVKEVSRYLQVDKFTVYRLIRKGFPAFKVGSQWRFKMRLVERWLYKQLNNKISLLFLAAFLTSCAFISPPSEEEAHRFVLQKTEGRRIFWSGLTRNYINGVTSGYVYVACGPNKKLWVIERV